MIIVSSSDNQEIAKKIAQDNNWQYIQPKIIKYSSNEISVHIKKDVENKVVVIFASIAKSVNNALMELLLLIDAAKNAKAKRVIAAVPYFGYGRGDDVLYKGESLSARLVARMLETAGIDELIVLELHSRSVQKFFSVPVLNIDAFEIFGEVFKDKQYSIVAPDQGAAARARTFSEGLDLPLVQMTKRRNSKNICQIVEIKGDVYAKDCLIIDDIVDTAETLSVAVELLSDLGARSINVCITHPVLSRGSLKKLNYSIIEKIYISNSIVHKKLPENFIQISIDKIFASKFKDLII